MAKYLFYLRDNALSAYLFQGRKLRKQTEFPNTDQGRAAFREFVKRLEKIDTYLLVDMVEESFEIQNFPYVFGRARRAMTERRLAQIYRDTPYTLAIPQGRESTGRRDLRVLTCALANPLALTPWVDAIDDSGVPFAGIFSAGLVSEKLLETLRIKQNHVLLVTEQSAGLRQSYLQQGSLKFSRLAPYTEAFFSDRIEVIGNNIQRTRDYLIASRLLPSDESLQVIFIADTYKGIPKAQWDAVDLGSRPLLLDASTVINQLRISKSSPCPNCDELLLSLIAARPPRWRYTFASQRKAYRLSRLRLALAASSAVCIVTATGIASWYIGAGLRANDDVLQINAITAKTEQEIQRAVAALPKTSTSVSAMSAIVNAYQSITESNRGPEAFMKLLAQRLDSLPNISVYRLGWRTFPREAKQDAQSQGIQANPHAIQDSALGVSGKLAEELVVEGKISTQEASATAALGVMNQLMASIATDRQVQVEATRAPIDIASNVSLRGKVGTNDRPDGFDFALKLVWNP